MADSHLVLYPQPHQWIVLPAHLQHTSQQPFLPRWHLRLSTQTHNLATSAQICHWCLSWKQMVQPIMEVIDDQWETLHYMYDSIQSVTNLDSACGSRRALSDVEEAHTACLGLAVFAGRASTMDDHRFALEQTHQMGGFLTLCYSNLSNLLRWIKSF